MQDKRYAYAWISVGCIWVAVALLSIFAPDLISGSEQEHIPVAALTTWFWGGAATALVLLAAARRGSGAPAGVWRSMAIMVGSIWAVVAIVGIASPVMITGSDPTRLPLGALVGPFAAVLVTAFVSVFVAGSHE
jgi:hypothetical protein